MMQKTTLLDIAKLRLSIGALGEKGGINWWSSAFFSTSSQAFLSPVFGRTTLLAQYHGVKEAASRVHDEFIGVGSGVFHLFRLPEMIEKELHDLLGQEELKAELSTLLATEESITGFLKEWMDASGSPETPVGPLRIGSTSDMNKYRSWKQMASLYVHAIERGSAVYPFFSETNE